MRPTGSPLVAPLVAVVVAVVAATPATTASAGSPAPPSFGVPGSPGPHAQGGPRNATRSDDVWGGGGQTIRVDSAGGGAGAFRPWMSGDGRVVTFDSTSDRLVAGDNNEVRDVFVYDRATDATARVSVASDGTQSNGESQRPTISADGRYVAFWSEATNLASRGTTRGRRHAYVHDRESGRTVLVSVSSEGAEGNGHSMRPVISRDGRYVAFESSASNLLGHRGLLGGSGDRNNVRDVFVHELARDGSGALTDGGRTRLVSASATGTPGDADSVRPTISADGQLIAFHSKASTLTGGVTNDKNDVYVRNMGSDEQHGLAPGEIRRISLAADGSEADAGNWSPSISADGRYVSFDSAARLVPDDTNRHRDVYLKDLDSGELMLVSVSVAGGAGDANSSDSSISGDGRYVSFWSAATNLVDGVTNDKKDVYVHDRDTRRTVRVSVSSDGTESNGDSFSPAISVDARYVAFDSRADNLAPGSATGQEIYVHVL